jgi:hypothetical protein
VGRSEVAGFGGDAVRLRRCGRRAMTGGAHLSARREEGQRRLEVGALSCDGGRNRVGRQRSTWDCWAGEDGGSPRMSGPAWWPGLARLVSIGKKSKGF